VLDLRDHLGMDGLNVTQDALGVGAQRVSHLAQIGHELEPLLVVRASAMASCE
jgi:hypothetical protein